MIPSKCPGAVTFVPWEKAIRDLVDIAKQSFSDWSEDGAPRLAAALAYYSAFSIAPLLFLLVTILSLVFADAGERVTAEVARYIGEDAAAFLNESAERSGPQGGVIATIIGVAALLFGAAGLFGQLQDALNTIWEVRQKPGQGIWGFIRQRFFSFALVGGTAFLLLVSLVVSTVISAVIDQFEQVLPGSGFVWQALNFLVAAGMTTVVFAVIFKVVPDAEIAWQDVWLGAAVTGVLFTVGQIALSLYLGMQSTDSAYGAAGSLIVILLWVYYAAQILFLGAEVTQVIARRRGKDIVPARGAERIGENTPVATSGTHQGHETTWSSDPTTRSAVNGTSAYWLGMSVGTAIRRRLQSRP